MEITIDRKTLCGFLVFLAILVLLSLAALGKMFTPMTSDENARILTWDDWTLFKTERQYQSERETLRSDADDLAALLNQSPDPVAAQLLEERIARHTSNGQAALASARAALLQAGQDAVSWSSGTLDRDSAAASLQTTVGLLK